MDAGGSMVVVQSVESAMQCIRVCRRASEMFGEVWSSVYKVVLWHICTWNWLNESKYTIEEVNKCGMHAVSMPSLPVQRCLLMLEMAGSENVPHYHTWQCVDWVKSWWSMTDGHHVQNHCVAWYWLTDWYFLPWFCTIFSINVFCKYWCINSIIPITSTTV